MDSQAVHSHHEGEEDLHEKKSVLKTVKAKARKLKDTITGHGHHEPEGHHTPGDHDLDEEDGEDLGDPEDHGAPIYDTVAATRKTGAPVQGDILKVPVVKSRDTRAARDEYDPAVPKSSANVNDPTRSHVPGEYGTGRDAAMNNTAATSVQSEAHRSGDDPVVPKERSNFTTGHEDLLGEARTKLTGPTTGPVPHHEESTKGRPRAPQNTTATTDVNPSKSHLSGNLGQPKGTNFGKIDELGEGTHGKYDTTTMDVNPSKTYGETNLGQTTLGKTNVLAGGTHMPQTHGTGKSAMDIDPKQTFVSGQGDHSSQSKVNLDRPRGLEEDPHTPDSNTPTNYATKVTDPTKSGGEEVGATQILHSFDKMNLHGDSNNQPPNLLSTGSRDRFESEKPSNATSAITGSAISAKNAVASKLGYGGNETEQSASSPREHQNKVLDQSTNQFVQAEAPKVRGTILEPDGTLLDAVGNKPSEQTGSSYTEKISSATSAIAEGAISAKNIVTSILGYGGGGDQVQDSTNVQQPREVARDNNQQGKPITSTVYEKVAGAGSAVMSKIGVGGGANKESGDGVGQAGNVDKGVNVKGYFAEKLKPGEEDKALSEVIKEKLHKQKPGESDGAKPMGKVTESAEVRQRLGDADGNDNFVVGRVKESVTSMMGGEADKADEEPEGHYVAEGRRLQESGN